MMGQDLLIDWGRIRGHILLCEGIDIRETIRKGAGVKGE